MQTSRHKYLLTALLLWFVPGCPDGKDPPAPTPTVSIGSGQYVLGAPATACTDDANDTLKGCDILKMGEDWQEENAFTPRARANLEGYGIERHEVTNAQYRYCEESGKCTPPASSEVGGVEYYGDDAHDEHPVVNVSWAQAEAYCAFVGRKLPTEAQWEVAARLTKNLTMTTFPRTNSLKPSCTSGSAYLLHKGCKLTTPRAKKYSARDASELGLRDMASNVSEWVRDAWNPRAYCDNKHGGADLACNNNPKPAACAVSCNKQSLCKAGTYDVIEPADKNAERVVRGGSYGGPICDLRLFVRRHALPQPSPLIGFRCVKEGAGPDSGVAPKDAGSDAGADSAVADAVVE